MSAKTVTVEQLRDEMMDWLEGRRSYLNRGPHPPYTPDVIAVMDAQEVVKRAAVFTALAAEAFLARTRTTISDALSEAGVEGAGIDPVSPRA